MPGAEVRSAPSTVGGGSLPDAELPSAALVLLPSVWGLTPDELARKLRLGDPPVLGRVEEDRVWIDPRTVQPEEEPALLEALRRIGG